MLALVSNQCVSSMRSPTDLLAWSVEDYQRYLFTTSRRNTRLPSAEASRKHMPSGRSDMSVCVVNALLLIVQRRRSRPVIFKIYISFSRILRHMTCKVPFSWGTPCTCRAMKPLAASESVMSVASTPFT